MRVDLHPEELVDAWLARQTSVRQRVLLAEHLLGCEACSAERTAVQHLQSKAATDLAGDEALVQSVLEALPNSSASDFKSRRGFKLFTALQRVALVVLSAMTVSAVAMASWVALEQSTFVPAVVTPQMRGHKAPRARRNEESRVAPRTVVLPTVTIVTDAAPRAPMRHTVARREVQPNLDAAPPVVSAAELFSLATDATASGRYDDALVTLARLRELYPTTRPAMTSYVTTAGILLHRLHRPAEARRAFDAYLARNARGALAAEARYGRALAIERGGDPVEARAAWSELVRTFPESPYARRAHEKLVAP